MYVTIFCWTLSMSTSCNSFPVYIMKVDRILPSCKMEGQIELCTKVCIIVTELHQTSPNFTQVHPGEERRVYREILIQSLTILI